MNKLLSITALFVFLLLFASIFSSLKNIDLVHNSEELGLVDNNGVVTQDMDQMYNNSFLAVWFTIPMSMFMMFLLGYSVGNTRKV